MKPMHAAAALLVCATLPIAAFAAGKLEVTQAWIRAAPPNATMLAGYANLRNSGDAPVVVTGASSAAFGGVSLHETVSTDGVERMRALDRITLEPGAGATLAPGGKHLMLMRPVQPLAPGQMIKIHFDTISNGGFDAGFTVREEAPPGG